MTRFTRDEQRTMMTLWCLFRSPLMFGGHLPDNDEWTLSLITNEEVLRLLKHSFWNRQLFVRASKRLGLRRMRMAAPMQLYLIWESRRHLFQ
ncbi:hypothetical protein [Paenibacillus rigui]|uniref:Uncharacterized protein n=1 Tax=Paenibacillus rigui TaxID=554312 RepID=A0A229UWX4_9BACL|nr:hypothetical protein [Paenibacillus rigui]OXM87429.1 hypothetical protein CF651_04820 [Paenibacillus rigui]